MALLDGLLGASFDDPKTTATLALAQGLLSAPKAMQGLNGGLLGYQQTMAQAKQQADAQQLQQLQLQQHQEALKQAQMQRAAQERQQAFLQGLQSPQQQAVAGALAGGGGPTQDNAAKMPAVDPQQDMLFSAVKAGAMPLDQYIASMRKDDTPITVKEGETLLDRRTRTPIYSAPGKEDDFIKNMRAAGIQPGSPQWNQTINAWLQKQSTHAPPVNVTVSTEKGYGERIAGGMAERDLAAIDAAKSAPDAIASAQRIRTILTQQKPITGAGADARLAISKALYTAGLTKGDDVVATENLQRELSQGVLAHIKTSGLGIGSGFSNADRDFLEKAAAGTIGVNALTLARTAELTEKAARKSIENGNQALKRVKSAPGLGTLPLMPEVAQPGNVIDFASLK